jgi:uncharacterized ferritin-like protein (DUF455 family)
MVSSRFVVHDCKASIVRMTVCVLSDHGDHSSGTRAASHDAKPARGLREAARQCLEIRDREEKVAATRRVVAAWRAGDLELEAEDLAAAACVTPGLPDGLVLVAPTKVPRRGTAGRRGLAALVHAIAHIEWNAINLAWDAVFRFRAMPREYYDDWTTVAGEEAEHFAMLRERLRGLDGEYGELPAHAGLWETAEATAGDVLDRMALVPRVLEARGLDVTPGIVARLRRSGDEGTAAILEVILREEVGHVRIGSRWFHHLCEQRGLAPAATFAAAIRRHFRGRPLPVPEASRPLRLEAGFREDELDAIDALGRDASSKAHW